MEFEDWVRNEKLKSCPFCGSEKLKIFPDAVSCENCSASGPWNGREDDRMAVKDWNTRPLENPYVGNKWAPDSTIEKDGVIYHIQSMKGIVVARWADPFNAYEKVYTEMGRIRPLYIQWSDWVQDVIDPLYESFKTMRGIARCMPTDTFDQNTGCQLARAKLKEKWRLRQKKVLNRAYDKHEEEINK